MANHIWQAASQQLFAGASTKVSTLSCVRLEPQSTFYNLEHLGLIKPQMCVDGDEPVTSFMTPAPAPLHYELGTYEDELVADPLSERTEQLLCTTARKNREIFTEVFRPVPSNLVRDFKAYKVSYPHFVI